MRCDYHLYHIIEIFVSHTFNYKYLISCIRRETIRKNNKETMKNQRKCQYFSREEGARNNYM